MKKTIAILMLISLFLMPVFAFAAAGEDDGNDTDITTTHAPTINVEDAINRITNWTFVFVLTIAVLFLLYAGFQFITAGGDPDRVTKARNTLFYGVVGVAIAVLAKGLVSLVRGVLGE